jgi:hypothetical protein
MKKIISILFFVAVSAGAFAQEDTTSTGDQPAKRKYIFKQAKDRIVIDLNATNWAHNIPGLKTKAYGRGIGVYFMWDFQIKKSFFSIAPGLGVSNANVYHRSQMMDTASTGITFAPLTNPENYTVNKLTTTYIEIPIELRFRTKPDRLDNMWKFVVGFKAGIKVGAYTKQSTKTPKESMTRKPYADLNLFQAGPMVRIGYSSFNITAYYGILGLFKNNRGPQVNAFSVGLSFNGL